CPGDELHRQAHEGVRLRGRGRLEVRPGLAVLGQRLPAVCGFLATKGARAKLRCAEISRARLAPSTLSRVVRCKTKSTGRVDKQVSKIRQTQPSKKWASLAVNLNGAPGLGASGSFS